MKKPNLTFIIILSLLISYLNRPALFKSLSHWIRFTSRLDKPQKLTKLHPNKFRINPISDLIFQSLGYMYQFN
jgi:hypothetical protein